jgi:hypothetical protein
MQDLSPKTIHVKATTEEKGGFAVRKGILIAVIILVLVVIGWVANLLRDAGQFKTIK